jgi:predicted nucleic acid-binding protein
MVELERILTGKLGFEPARWQQVSNLLIGAATDVAPPPPTAPEAVTGDPANDVILSCAIQAGVDALISGDRKHLLPVGVHRGVRIITPQAALAELRAG